jgi:hypothetical protein
MVAIMVDEWWFVTGGWWLGRRKICCAVRKGVSAQTRDVGFMVFTLGCEYIITKETPPSQLAPPAWRGLLKAQRGLGFQWRPKYERDNSKPHPNTVQENYYIPRCFAIYG